MLDRALQRRVSFAAVRAAQYRNLGCRGSHQAGLLLAAAGDRASAQSERLFIGLMKDAGITGWQVNRRLEPGLISAEVDFRFNRERRVIEIDGPDITNTTASRMTARSRTRCRSRSGRCFGSPGSTSPNAPSRSSKRFRLALSLVA